MKLEMKSSFYSVIILFGILIVLAIFYRRYEDKKQRESEHNNYHFIQQYLYGNDYSKVNTESLAKTKKPILWIHVPYEYNARHWISFGSRSSFELNQPYLYLTAKSIIQQCKDSFTICIIDDQSFRNLLPTWSIDMTCISSPILENMRTLGLMKLLYTYGGLLCPLSFLCMKDLITMYDKGTRRTGMFLCEVADRNVTSTAYDFYPSLSFCGCVKECKVMEQLIAFIQRTSSRDYTAASVFLGDFDRWCEKRIQTNQITLISGRDIGTKSMNDEPILLEDLLSNHYLDIYTQLYGILIPSKDILSRRKYEWFARMSPKQVLESDTILGNYMLVNIGQQQANVLEPMEMSPDWISFWRVPSGAPVWGQMPLYLGNNVPPLTQVPNT